MAISSNQDVQNALNVLGYVGADGNPLAVDGAIGPNSQFAIKAFQTAHSLTVDGIAGPQTKNALQAAIDLKAASATGGVPNVPSPTATVTVTHVPPAQATPTTPAVAAHTVVTNVRTGATTTAPFGTPVSKATSMLGKPLTTAEKAGIALGVTALVVGFLKFRK